MIETRRFCSYDGTDLAYHVGGDPDGIPLVFCGGLGGSVAIWRPFFEHFGDRFRLISWDYRGLYGSEPASRAEEYGIENHVADLVQLLEHESIDSPVLVGWSMGVQVALELHREHANLPAALVAIHGTYGRPLKTAFDSSWASSLSPLALGALRLVRSRLGLVGPYLARSTLVSDSFVWFGQQLGVMSSTLDHDLFRDIAEEWSRLDLGVYADTFEHMNAHDAADLLASIKTPSLIIAGDRDRFTPAHLAQRMAKEMPDAVLEVVSGATHFGLIEYPEAIIHSVEHFMRERLNLFA